MFYAFLIGFGLFLMGAPTWVAVVAFTVAAFIMAACDKADASKSNTAGEKS